jgi:hypothetical protein
MFRSPHEGRAGAQRPAPRHVPVARISAVAAVAVGAYLVIHNQSGPHWRPLQPGVEFTTLRGEPWCRRGSAAIGVLRLDPAVARLRVLHYTLTSEPRPPDIVEWQRRTGALAVFNAGQFYPDWSYMGLLVCSGRIVSREAHPAFKAALVAAPEKGAPAIRVLDLSARALDPRSPGWGEVAQSFMLIDEKGGIRVRKSDHVANRTVVAEDRRGRVLVLTSEGGYTLWEFADLLRHSPIAVSHAMAMDGGYEAEMCVRSPAFRWASFGRWDDDHAGDDAAGARTPLPAVIAIEAR